MCRGAGGLAGHVRFGARTGGALVILGGLLLGLALFYADSVATVFRLFPPPILGVILFFGGMELAASVNGESYGRAARTVFGRDGRRGALERGCRVCGGPASPSCEPTWPRPARRFKLRHSLR